MAVAFTAELTLIKSRPDKTYDVTLNVSEFGLDAIRDMAGWVHDEVAVAVENVTQGEPDSTELSDGRKRRKR